MKNIDVFGSFGFGNLGDEIIPKCIERAINYNGNSVLARAFSRYNNLLIPKILDHAEYLNSDLFHPVLISGGGIIENHSMSCLNRAMVKKGLTRSDVIPFAISVEPGVDFGLRTRLSLRNKLKSFECIYVRDQLSSDTLKSLAPKIKQKVVGDLGLWCTGEGSTINQEALPKEYAVFIPSDNWNSDDFYRWISKELIEIANNLNLPILVMPISVMYGHDVSVCNKILRAINLLDRNAKIISIYDFGCPTVLSGDDVARILSRSKLTISMRLHGCVISYAQKSPFIALAYHPKLFGFVKTINWNHAIVPNNISFNQSKNAYGYNFKDLALLTGDLSCKVDEVLAKQEYEMLEIFKFLQSDLLNKLVDFS